MKKKSLIQIEKEMRFFSKAYLKEKRNLGGALWHSEHVGVGKNLGDTFLGFLPLHVLIQA